MRKYRAVQQLQECEVQVGDRCCLHGNLGHEIVTIDQLLEMGMP